jgi:type VI secretion system secreted protein Hcp
VVHRVKSSWASRVAGSALILALALTLYGASGTGTPATTAEAGDLASMLAVMQSMQAPAAASLPGGESGPTSQQVASSVDYFLKIAGIDGESTDDRHRGEIDLLSFSWGVANSGSVARAGGAGAGRAEFSDFQLAFATSAASPALFIASATGQHLGSAVLTLRKAGGEQQEYLQITLTDVLISSYQQSAGGDHPTEQISLNFGKIEFEYRPQQRDGSLGAPVKAGYDLKANRRL